ncbi:MAG: metallopeptidase family protein [Eubacteriales bacterium]|jgi:hypothetical protein
MVRRDRFDEILDELCCELPEAFYRELNGGIIVLNRPKPSPHAVDGNLWILGEYSVSQAFGRCIYIYFGSFTRVFGPLPEDALRVEMRRVLRHEFRHHVESLAGERGLELEDRRRLEEYLQRSENA